MRPLISVVCPVWNRAHTINNAIHSILDQTYKDFEMIIVDDGSDDEEIRLKVAQFGDSRLKYVRTAHQGVVAARNYGNSLAKGEWILMQDSDDLSLPDRMEKLLAISDGADIVVSGLYVNVWSAIRECISRIYVPCLPESFQNILKEQAIPGIPMYKKSVWEKKPFRMETQYAYDWMMWLDWIYSGFLTQTTNTGLYEYVRQEDSVSIRFEQEGLRTKSLKEIAKIMMKEYAQDFRGLSSLE